MGTPRMWGGLQTMFALGVLPGLDAQPEALPSGHTETAEPPGEDKKTGVEGIYSRENSGSLGETVYWLQAPEALVGSAVRAGAPRGRGLGGRQGSRTEERVQAAVGAEGAPPFPPARRPPGTPALSGAKVQLGGGGGLRGESSALRPSGAGARSVEDGHVAPGPTAALQSTQSTRNSSIMVRVRM